MSNGISSVREDLLQECSHYGPVTAVKFYGDHLLVGYGPVLKLFHIDPTSSAPRLLWQKRIFKRNKIHCISVSDDHRLVAVSGGRSFAVMELESLRFTEKAINEWIISIDCVSATEVLILTSHNEVLQVQIDGSQRFSVEQKLHCNEKSLLYSGAITRCSNGKTYVAAGTVMSGVLIWDLHSRQIVHTLSHHEGSIFAVNIDKDAQYVISCSDDRSIKLYDFTSGDLLATGWGHGSRIWTLSFGHISASEITLVSTGEDCSARVWRHKLGSSSLDQIECFDNCHEGKHVWSGDANWSSQLVATGGADGKVRVLNVSPERAQHNNFTSESISEATGVVFDKKETIKYFAELPHIGGLVVLSTRGKVFFHSQHGWKFLDVGAEITSALQEFAVLRAYSPGNAVVVCSRAGDLLVLGFSPDSAEQIYQEWIPTAAKSPVKIINMLSSQTSDGLLLLMDCPNPNMPLYARVLTSKDGKLQLSKDLELQKPDPRNFIPTSAYYHPETQWLVVGSRHANFAVYNLAQNLPPYLVRKICPGDTITSISYAYSTDDLLTVLVTVRDGVYMLVRLSFGGEFSHEIVVQNKFSKGSLEGGFYRDNQVFLYGFRSAAFYLWNETKQVEVYYETCGGGHRSWEFTDCGPDKFHFTFVGKAVLVQNVVQSRFGITHNGLLASGTHGREIRSVAVCDFAEDDGSHLIATASEDATVKLGYINEHKEVRYVWSMNNHVSGLQTVKFLNSEFLASSAANEELIVWKLDRGIPQNVSIVEHARLHTVEENPDLRVMDFSTLEVAGGFLFACVFSNSVVKIFFYDISTRQFRLLSSEIYSTYCLLNVEFLQTNERTFVVVGATDGFVTVWDVTSGVGSFDHFSFDRPIIKQQLHQSGVKAFSLIPSGSSWKLITGGDDNALVLSELTFENETLHMSITASVEAAASATITGIASAGDKVLVTSVDQIVRLWDISQELVCLSATYTTVADTGCCTTTSFGKHELGVVAGAGLSIFECRAEGNHRSLGALEDDVLVVLEHALELDGVLGQAVLDENLVGGVQAGLLPQSSDTVDQLSSQTLALQLRVRVDVQDDQHVSLGSGLVAGSHLLLGQTTSHLQVLADQVDAVDCKLAGLSKLLDVLGRNLGQSGLDLLGVLLQLLTEHGPVSHGVVLDTVLLLVRGDDDVSHVQFGRDVALQGLNVLQVAGVGVQDDQLLQRRLQRNHLLLSDVTAQVDDLLHSRNGQFDGGVEQLLSHDRTGHEVHGLNLLGGRVDAVLDQVLGGEKHLQLSVDTISQEWSEWSHESAQNEQTLGQSVETLLGVLDIASVTLDTTTVESDVPVGQVVDQGQQSRHHGKQSVGLHLLVDKLDQRSDGGHQPLVHDILRHQSGVVDEVSAVLLLEHLSSVLEELEGVVPWQQHRRNDLSDTLLLELQGLGLQHGRVDHVQSQGVGTVLLQHVVWVRVVLQTLGHLLTVSSQHNTGHNDVLVWGSVEQVRTQHGQGVEPTSGLVQTFRDEVGGETLVEGVLSLEGVVSRSVGHGTGLEPAVEHLLDSLQVTLALLRGNDNVVDAVSVDISDVVTTGQLLQLLNGTDTDNFLEVVTDPQWDGSTPVSVSGDVPVSGVGNPVGESLLLDGVGHPVGLLHILQHSGDDASDTHKPGGHGTVQQWGVGSPTEWVRVIDLRGKQHSAVLGQVLDDQLVGVLHVHTNVVWHLAGELTVVIDRVGWRSGFVDDAGLGGSGEIDLTEGWSSVHNTSTGVGGDEVGGDDAETVVLESLVEVVVDGLVLEALQGLTLESVHNLVLGCGRLLVQGLDQALQQDVVSSLVLVEDLDILELGVHTKSDVGGQGPGRGGPGHQPRVLVVHQGETNGHCRVVDVLVVSLSLEVGQRRGAAGGVRHDPQATVHGVLSEQLLESPPHRLHELGVQGLVVVVHVDPTTHTADGSSPLVGISHDNGTALLVVVVDTHLHDVFLSSDAQLLVDLVLDGQPVRVPAESSFDVVTVHRGVSGDNVLDGGGQEMAVMWRTSCKWRAVEKREPGRVFGQIKRFLKRIESLPLSEDLLFLVGEVEEGVGFFCHVGSEKKSDS